MSAAVQQHCPKCGAPLAANAPAGLCTRCALAALLSPAPVADAVSRPDASKTFPRRFGEYELLEEIARGGMGIVYKARQQSLNRTVALKVILSGVMASEDFVERFRTEAEAAASMDQPNIGPIHEIGEHAGEHFFTMKFVDGETLAQRISRDWSAGSTQPHDGEYLRSTAELIAALARAVHYAHQRGILHRDIKPNNVLLAKDGAPHLTDFGLAKLVEKESTITKTMAVLGTPSYMSPEQARGETKRLTTAADVYGLGAIFYELLTGRPPFAGGTTMATIQQVLEKEPTPPSAGNANVDHDLETVCLKCLRKEPEERYASAEALANDLERWLRHEPIEARPIGTRERMAKWVRRNPRGTVLLTVTAIAVLGLIVVPTLLSLRLREANSRAALKAEENRQSLVQLNVGRGVDLLERADLAGSLPWFVEALKLDAGNPEREAVHRTRIAAVLNQLPRLAGVLVHPTNMTTLGFSPDGRRVLMYSEEGAFAQVWDLATGQLIPPPVQHRGYLRLAQFNHKGDRIITASHDGTAMIWNAQTGQPSTPPLQHGAGITWAALSPDDRRLVTVGFGQGAKVWNTENGERLATYDQPGTANFVAF